MKILILQQFLPHYRVPVFNQLAQSENISLTVAHGDTEQLKNTDISFNQVILKFKKVGPFYYTTASLVKLANQFDIVLASGNIKILSFVKLGLVQGRRYKYIIWGPGVTVGKGYDVPNAFDSVRYWYAKLADAVVFYVKYPIEKYIAAGVKRDKLFVAHNTVKLDSEFLFGKQNGTQHLLFLGTLYYDKHLEILLQAVAFIKKQYDIEIAVDVVGDGPMKEPWQQLTKELGLELQVFFHGKINDEQLQKPFFARALACVSPGQAGLSVLQSMAYGIPFVTEKDGITGGERMNIEHEYNGLFYDGSVEGLAECLMRLISDPIFAAEIAKNAYLHYNNNCLVEHMISGFLDAFQFVSKSEGKP